MPWTALNIAAIILGAAAFALWRFYQQRLEKLRMRLWFEWAPGVYDRVEFSGLRVDYTDAVRRAARAYLRETADWKDSHRELRPTEERPARRRVRFMLEAGRKETLLDNREPSEAAKRRAGGPPAEGAAAALRSVIQSGDIPPSDKPTDAKGPPAL